MKVKKDLVLHYSFNSLKIRDMSENSYNIKSCKHLKRVNSPEGKALLLPIGDSILFPISEIGYNYTLIMKLKRENET